MKTSSRRDKFLTWLTLAVWIVVLGCGLLVFRLMYRNHRMKSRLTAGIEETHRALETEDKLPTKNRIAQWKSLKSRVQAEYERCRNFYIRADAPIDRHILQAGQVDAAKFALNYTELKKKLASKAHSNDFLEPYDWEEEGKLPDPDRLPIIEKKASIVSTIVDGLATVGGAVVERASVGDAQTPPGLPESQPTGDYGPVRHRLFPSKFVVIAPFSKLSPLLSAFSAQVPDDPCSVLKNVRWSSVKKTGYVRVTLKLNIMDFYLIDEK